MHFQLLTAFTAHRQAYDAGYIHGDISAKNIFLYPIGTTKSADGTEELVYQAILADWELAKRTGEEYDLIRQRERTVRVLQRHHRAASAL